MCELPGALSGHQPGCGLSRLFVGRQPGCGLKDLGAGFDVKPLGGGTSSLIFYTIRELQSKMSVPPLKPQTY
jgi:hypothetical protein